MTAVMFRKCMHTHTAASSQWLRSQEATAHNLYMGIYDGIPYQCINGRLLQEPVVLLNLELAQIDGKLPL